jgi:polysaccharide biosynthesis/export protein
MRATTKHLFSFVTALAVWAGLIAAPAAQTSYVLGPSDAVHITVLGEEDLSRKYTIEQDGTFTFPLIGRVTAKGLTLRELEAELKKQLAAGYLRNPQVQVAIEDFKSQRITVWGQVNQPAEYPFTGDMSLLTALARAGGVTPAAGREVLIIRASQKRPADGTAAEPEMVRVDLAELQAGNMALNVPLQNGDTVNVPKAQQAFVSGHVKSPGGYPVEPGMTVLQVLSLAGGVSERGSDKRISILRTVDGKKKELKGVKLTDVVEPGDTIVVGPRLW